MKLKRYRHITIGGISTKVLLLILVTVVLLTGSYIGVSVRQNRLLGNISDDAGARQQQAGGEVSAAVMRSVINQYMDRSTKLEAAFADNLFQELKTEVQMVGDYAARILSSPDEYPDEPFAPPSVENNGVVTTQMIWAEGVDPYSPEIAEKLALAAGLSDMMEAVFAASPEVNSVFIALPDGVTLVADDRSAARCDADGNPILYDPRTRPWYQLAVEKKRMIFTDVETDAFTGDIGIVCAIPVYIDGELAAVVGSDLFLSSMRRAASTVDANGTFRCVINQHGHVVFSPMEEGIFRVLPSGEAEDLRQSSVPALSALLSDAMDNNSTGVQQITLPEGDYFMIAEPMNTVGWVLLSVCDADIINQPTVLLQSRYNEIREETDARYRSETGRLTTASIILIAAITLAMLIGAIWVSGRIVNPLNLISRDIAEMSDENLEFTMKDRYRTGDEVEEMATSFAALSHRTMEYMEEIRAVTAEKERIGAELSLATQIQASMLPHVFPPFPDRSEFDLYAVMDPAREVGGDFYDYFLIDSDHLALVMADVSGKGVPAALFMMASKIILQSVAMLGKPVAEILEKTNEAICSGNESQMFVTVWLGILEISTGRLTAANAGHEYPAIRRPDGQFELYKDRHGFVLGGLDGAKYREYELQLEPGARLFLYTDGVPEATNAGNELFGTDRMLAALNRNPAGSSREILENVRKAVDDFVLDAEQFDDLTMLCLEYKKGMKK